MKNDRLNGSRWLSVVGCWRNTKGLPSSFLPTLALVIALTFLLAPPLLAQWEPDVRLTYDINSSTTSFNNASCIAASGDTVHVVWTDSRNRGYNAPDVFYKRSTDGGSTWEPDTRLSFIPDTAYGPAIAVSGLNVHVVWWGDVENGNPEIFHKRSTDGGTTWVPDTRLTSDTSYSQFPSIAVLGSNVHVVWRDGRYTGWPSVFHKYSTDGGITWGPDTRLSSPRYSIIPCVAITRKRPFIRVHIIWSEEGNGEEIFYKKSSDGGRTWSQDTCLTLNTPDRSVYPAIATSGSNVHIVWWDRRDGFMCIYHKRTTDDGLTWDPDNRLTSTYSTYPSVAASGQNVHVVWQDFRDNGFPRAEIYYKSSTDGGVNWGPDVRLTEDSAYSSNPFTTAFGTKVHVVWGDTRDGNYEIYYKRNPTGNSGTETAEERGRRLEVRIRPKPNPFTSLAMIPGREKETFELYDIAGRKVGTYPGDRVGANLPAGVYFLRTSGKTSTPVRIVKVR